MRILVFLFTASLIFACGSPSSNTAPAAPAQAGTGSLEGFNISEISGTNLSTAVRTDDSNNILEEGNTLNGKKEGAWMTYYSSNRDKGKIKTLTNYHNGVKNGIDLTFAKNGTIETKSTFANGNLNGAYAKFKSSRKLEEATYSNGQLTGVYRTFYNTGKLQQESHYSNGKKHGKSTYYNQEEEITMEYEYKNGEQVSGGKVDPPRPTKAAEEK